MKRTRFRTSWRKMCEPMKDGGTGFKDLKMFYAILLAKQ